MPKNFVWFCLLRTCIQGCHHLRGRRAGSSLYVDVNIEVGFSRLLHRLIINILCMLKVDHDCHLCEISEGSLLFLPGRLTLSVVLVLHMTLVKVFVIKFTNPILKLLKFLYT